MYTFLVNPGLNLHPRSRELRACLKIPRGGGHVGYIYIFIFLSPSLYISLYISLYSHGREDCDCA